MKNTLKDKLHTLKYWKWWWVENYIIYPIFPDLKFRNWETELKDKLKMYISPTQYFKLLKLRKRRKIEVKEIKQLIFFYNKFHKIKMYKLSDALREYFIGQGYEIRYSKTEKIFYLINF